MSYNGRDVAKGVAYDNDWTVRNHPMGTTGDTLVTYERGWTQIIIIWSAENTAKAVVKNHGTPNEVVAKGPLSLIEARRWMEESSNV